MSIMLTRCHQFDLHVVHYLADPTSNGSCRMGPAQGEGEEGEVDYVSTDTARPLDSLLMNGDNANTTPA